MSDENEPSPLTRDVLAAFLPNHPAIKAFEKLIALVRRGLPSAIQDALIAADLAAEKANDALAQLTRIADSLELLAFAPLLPPTHLETIVGQVRAEVEALNGQMSELLLAPPVTSESSVSVFVISGVGAPVDGIAGTGIGSPKQWLYIDETGSDIYINAGTTVNASWKLIGRSA